MRALADQARSTLEAGGIVCLPTESTYGLAVDAGNAEALQALGRLKGRDPSSPFGLIAASAAQARAWTGPWPERAVRLAEEHWPGPLTLILPPRTGLSSLLIGPSGGVGLRVSSQESVRAMVEALGRPITATSANPAGQPAATDIAQARSYFSGGVDFYWDDGVCNGTPSTLIDFDDSGEPVVLREGPISLPR